MRLLPAIDILDGKVVRLFKGKFEENTVYHEDPIEVAKHFKAQGVEFLHIVDLSGAREEKTRLYDLLKAVIGLGLDVQVGGGIRTESDIKKLLDIGAKRVIIGTKAVYSPGFVMEAVKKFGADKIVVALDVDGGYVKVKGWQESSGTTLKEMLSVFSPSNATILVTDISRDGTLHGIDIGFYDKIAKHYPSGVIISGGVSSLKDIESAVDLAGKRSNIDAIIVGKAVYEGKVDLKEALKICSQSV